MLGGDEMAATETEAGGDEGATVISSGLGPVDPDLPCCDSLFCCCTKSLVIVSFEDIAMTDQPTPNPLG